MKLRRTNSVIFMVALFVTGLLITAPVLAQPKVMTPELLWKLGRLGSSSISPSERVIAYSVRNYELKENAGRSTIFIHVLRSGSTISPISDWKVIGGLEWIKFEGQDQLVFEGMRGDEKDSSVQAWMLRLSDLKLRKMTDIEGGIANLKVSPTGKHLAFTLDVKMDDTVNELYKDLPHADARVIDGLMYRHWNQWHDYKYSHVHVASIEKDGTIAKPVDLMAGIKADCPVPPFNGSENFAWSPDGNEIAYTTKLEKKWAESTNSDVYLVKTTGGEAKNISNGRLGYDNNPVYSADGKSIAFNSMPKAGFESDRNHIMVYDRQSGSITDPTADIDQTCHGAHFLTGGGFAYTSEHRGTDQIFCIKSSLGASEDSNFGRQLSKGLFNYSLIHVLKDGKRGLVSYMSMLRPRELGILNFVTGELTKISDINGAIYKDLQLPTIKERWIEATDGKKIHSWVIYPPNFTRNKNGHCFFIAKAGPKAKSANGFHTVGTLR